MALKMDSIDSGSNYNFESKLMRAQAPRSLFDLSHLNSLTIPNCGMLIPVDFFETVPGDHFDLSVDCLLRVMPQVVPLYSRQRLYFYSFYARCSDLWKQANTYFKKGYNGSTVIQKPMLKRDLLSSSLPEKVTPDSLADYLGIPIGTHYSDLINYVSVLPFFMYFKVWQNYFMNKNLYIDNRVYLPDDDDDLRIGVNGDIISNSNTEDTSEKIRLGEILFRDYPDDYFLSCLPFAQRGNQPKLPIDFSINSDVSLDFNGNIQGSAGVVQNSIFYGADKDNIWALNPSSSTSSLISRVSVNDAYPNLTEQAFKSKIPYKISASDLASSLVGSGFGFTLDQFRELAIATSELEKMARTDGTYGEFGLTFFGLSSRNSNDYKITFIGSSYQSIAFSEVLQTGSTTETSPLGTQAGHGISSGSGRIGSIDCDDYGYIMTIACIMPDVYYSQGIEKHWTRQTQSEEFLPERSKMGLVPVLNEEIFFSGISDEDKDLFAYQNPFDYLRYRPNQIHGKIADSENLSFFPYTQSRKFAHLPTFSQELFRADDVRKDYLFAPVEDAYTMQVNLGCRAVRPLPYRTEPATII